MYYVEYRIFDMRKNHYKDIILYNCIIFTEGKTIKEKEASEIIQRAVNRDYDDIEEYEEEHCVFLFKLEEIEGAYDYEGNEYPI